MLAETVLMMLRSLAAQPVLLVLAIVVATFILEDAATVAVGLLASQMVLDPSLALSALLAGTILGDLALHLLGRGASHTKWGQRVAMRPAVAEATIWLRRRSDVALALARFAPGLRLPVYAASGFIRAPLPRVIVIVTIVSALWTPGLFG